MAFSILDFRLRNLFQEMHVILVLQHPADIFSEVRHTVAQLVEVLVGRVDMALLYGLEVHEERILSEKLLNGAERAVEGCGVDEVVGILTATVEILKGNRNVALPTATEARHVRRKVTRTGKLEQLRDVVMRLPHLDLPGGVHIEVDDRRTLIRCRICTGTPTAGFGRRRLVFRVPGSFCF